MIKSENSFKGVDLNIQSSTNSLHLKLHDEQTLFRIYISYQISIALYFWKNVNFIFLIF